MPENADANQRAEQPPPLPPHPLGYDINRQADLPGGNAQSRSVSPNPLISRSGGEKPTIQPLSWKIKKAGLQSTAASSAEYGGQLLSPPTSPPPAPKPKPAVAAKPLTTNDKTHQGESLKSPSPTCQKPIYSDALQPKAPSSPPGVRPKGDSTNKGVQLPVPSSQSRPRKQTSLRKPSCAPPPPPAGSNTESDMKSPTQPVGNVNNQPHKPARPPPQSPANKSRPPLPIKPAREQPLLVKEETSPPPTQTVTPSPKLPPTLPNQFLPKSKCLGAPLAETDSEERQRTELHKSGQGEEKKQFSKGKPASAAYALPNKHGQKQCGEASSKPGLEREMDSANVKDTPNYVGRETQRPPRQNSLMLRYRRRLPTEVDTNTPPERPSTKPCLPPSDKVQRRPAPIPASQPEPSSDLSTPQTTAYTQANGHDSDDIYDQVYELVESDGTATDTLMTSTLCNSTLAKEEAWGIDDILHEMDKKDARKKEMQEGENTHQESITAVADSQSDDRSVSDVPQFSMARETGYEDNTEPLYDDPAFDSAEEEGYGSIDGRLDPELGDLYESVPMDSEDEDKKRGCTPVPPQKSNPLTADYAQPLPKSGRENSLKKAKTDEKKKSQEYKRPKKQQQDVSKLVAKRRKQFKLTGDEEAEFVATAKTSSQAGDAGYLSYESGDKFAVLFTMPSSDREMPADAWMVQAIDGTYGFVEIENMQVLPQTSKEDAMRDEEEVIDAVYESVASVATRTERSDTVKYAFSHNPMPAKPESLPAPKCRPPPPPAAAAAAQRPAADNSSTPRLEM